MRVVSLHFQKVSTIVGNDEIGLLTLVTDDGTRQINITGDNQTLFQFSLRLLTIACAASVPIVAPIPLVMSMNNP